MIDSHCHLEVEDFDNDRDQVIENCKKELKAVIISATEPKYFETALNIAKKYKNFIFACFGLHPEYIKEVNEKVIENYFDFVKENLDHISAIGEVGLDYFWIKENYWREKQKEVFKRMIEFSREIKKPLVIHSRDAYEDSIKILEQEDAKKVLLHLFGASHLVKRVIENNFYVSFGPIILVSKKHKELAKNLPIELILAETDSPWNSPKIFLEKVKERNTPLNVKFVYEKIAEIKNLNLNNVIEEIDSNAIKFFELFENES